MDLKLYYDCSAHLVLSDPNWSKKAKKLRDAGVGRMWLFGYFYGFWESDPEEIFRARQRLIDDGFEVEAINLPFGHGGNALDLSDSNVNLGIGDGWKPTMDRAGNYISTTTCINEKMLEDTKKSAEILYEMGIRELFFDDDLRFGHWGAETQGCFCPDCIKNFSETVPSFTPDMLDYDRDIHKLWCDFQSEKIVDFLSHIRNTGMKVGAMVMHNGDRRHGIDIEMMKKKIPDIFFRVGEGHFSDQSYLSPLGKSAIEVSIHNHLSKIGNSIAYSETTVFPKNALSPENLVDKMKLEIGAGLRNLYFMSGTVFLDDMYWDAVRDALPELRFLAENTAIPEHKYCEPIWDI